MDQCDRDRRCAVEQGGQQEPHQHAERNEDSEQGPQSPPAGDHDDHRTNAATMAISGQAARSLERVAGRARRVALADDSDVVADPRSG